MTTNEFNQTSQESQQEINVNNSNTNIPINNANSETPLSVTAIISLVLGSVAIGLSFIPIVNNGSFFLAIIGIVLGIIGLVGILKKKKRNKVIVIIALILNVVAIVIVLATQSMYGDAIKTATNTASQATSSTSSTPAPSSTQKKDNQAKFGETITMNNSLELTVVSVQGGLTNFDGSPVSKVIVTYNNKGKKEVSFNNFDWKAENSSGAQTNSTIYSGTDGNSANSDVLSSGTLAAGGTITGTLYFKGDVTKMLYSSTVFSGTTATWTA